MARTPYVKNYETVEDFPSEVTPYGATQLQNIEDSISGIDTDLAILEAILGVSTDTFSEASTYALDEFVIYQNKLWRCTTAVTVAGAWTGATNWTESSIIEAGRINSKLIEKNILTGKLGNNITTVATTYTVIPVASLSYIGIKLSISSGKILIGAGVSKIMVSAFIQYQKPNAGVFVFKTQRNRSGTVADIGVGPFNLTVTENTVPVPTALYDVQEGDLIQLVYYDAAANNTIIKDGTLLTVEVVE